jgi:hypothetical protein
LARKHRRVLPPHLPAPCADLRSDIHQPLQMLGQQLHRLVLVALHHRHARQMHQRVHPEVRSPELHGQVKRRPQPRLSLLQCVSARRRDTAAALAGPGLLETGDRPVVLSMPGQAAPEVAACPRLPPLVVKLLVDGQ